MEHVDLFLGVRKGCLPKLTFIWWQIGSQDKEQNVAPDGYEVGRFIQINQI